MAVTDPGALIRGAIYSDAGSAILRRWEIGDWGAGGCGLLADALLQLWPDAKPWAIVSGWGVEHVLVERAGTFYDSVGAATRADVERHWREEFAQQPMPSQSRRERSAPRLTPLTAALRDAAEENGNVDFYYDATEQTVALLRAAGVAGRAHAKPLGTLGALGEASFFADQDGLVEQIKEIADSGEADNENFDPSEEYSAAGVADPGDAYRVRRVRWLGSRGHMVKIAAECVRFTPENEWNLAHAAAVYQAIRAADPSDPIALRAPAGRVYRIDAARLKQDWNDYGMTRPFTRAYKDEYYAQLLDGNHRASAAIAAGEPHLWIYCGEDYLENVAKKDLK